MLAPAHFAAGAAVSRLVRPRPLGLALALVSHFALDAVPHFEDPGLLPSALAPIIARHWGWLLVAVQFGVVPLAMGVWSRYRSAARGRRWDAAYLIAGGLLACLPDLLRRLPGCSSPAVRAVLDAGHRVWFPAYAHTLAVHPSWRPLGAALCIALEATVLAVSVWVILVRRPEGAGEDGKPPSSDAGR